MEIYDLRARIRRAERLLSAALGVNPDGPAAVLDFLAAEAASRLRERTPETCPSCGGLAQMLAFLPYCSQLCQYQSVGEPTAGVA